MTKKLKILYVALILINVLACVVCTATGNYIGAIASGITAVWLCVCFSLVRLLCEAEEKIEEYQLLIMEQKKKKHTKKQDE